MTALSPGRFGPLPDDPLLTGGLWQYAHYYGPVTSAPRATTPAGVAQPGLDDQPRAHRCSGLVTLGNQNSFAGLPRTAVMIGNLATVMAS
jgi:hypothetical protein